MKNKIVLWSMICLILYSAMPNIRGSISHAAEAPRVVRVGYFPTDNFQEIDEDGEYSGYGYDFLQEIAQFSNWEYEYVVDSFTNCYQMMMNHEIDLLCGISKDENLLEYFDFSNQAMSTTQYELYALSGNTKLYYESYESFEGMKVAVIDGNKQLTQLDQYAQQHHFTIQKVEYATQLDMENALIKGEVDAMYASNSLSEAESKIIARFQETEVYFATWKGNPVMDELNKAVDQIAYSRPYFKYELYQKFMRSNNNFHPDFTMDELNYIKQAKPIKVAYDPAWYPIEYCDPKTGEFTGITRDLFDRLSEYTGLKFDYITTNNVQESLDALAENKADILTALTHDYTWANENNVYMTGIYLNTSVAMITRNNNYNHIKVIALPRGYYTSQRIVKNSRDEEYLYCHTIGECLDAVVSGRADATYANNYVADYFLSKIAYRNLQAMQLTNYTEDLSIAVSKDADGPLLSILDKALLCISQNEIDTYILKNSISAEKFSFKNLIYTEPQLFVGIILIVFIVLIILIFMNYKRQAMELEMRKTKEASDAKGSFLATMSHEIRTPLNAVIGYVNMTIEHEDNREKRLDYLNKAGLAAKHLLTIINDVLDISAISSGKMVISQEGFDVTDMITDQVNIFSQQAQSKNIDFQVVQKDIVYKNVVGDRLRLTQILMNLLSNAMKFTNQDGTITFSIKQTVTENDDTVWMEFQVADTGIGMTKAYMQKLFTPFEQQDASSSRKYGGSGLGLSITKQLIELMKGTISVESEQGKGSTFTVKLPFVKDLTKGEKNQEIPSFEKLRALILETDAGYCSELQKSLKACGIKSDVAAEPEKVLRQLEKRKGTDYAYKICFLSWDFLSGNEKYIEQIRALCREDMPLLITMKGSETVAEQEAKNLGIAEILDKAAEPEQVYQSLVQHFPQYIKKQAANTVDSELKGMTVLLAEDNEMNMEISENILKKADMKVIKAVNGQEAVQRFMEAQQGTIGIILMDIQMPVMDGYEAARQIRKADRQDADTVPIIALTANAFAEDVNKALAAGMNAHISKPISQEKLFELLKRVLGTADSQSVH